VAITRKRWFPVTVVVDEPIHLQIKRMTPEEFETFDAQFTAFGEGRGAPMPAGADLSATTRAMIQAQTEYLRANAEWMREVFEAYVKVAPDDLFDEDDAGAKVPVLTGGHFADVFGGHPVLSEVLTRIWTENRLSDEQKKKLLSRSDSGTGSSTTSSQAPPGPTPERAATAAGPEASAPSADAMAYPGIGSSGTTVQ
jgi:hypothetical protein